MAAVLTAASAEAQEPPRDIRRFAAEQWGRFRPLFTLVQEASEGQPVPSDGTVAWQSHVLKAEEHTNFVPFTLKLPPGLFTSFPLAMYLRVVQHGAVATAPGPRDALAQYPFEDVALFDEPIDGRISRGFLAPAGLWDVYVALRETGSEVHAARTIVLKREVDLPDLSTGLAVSSIIVADKIEIDRDTKPLDFEAQLDGPYRLWGMRITPAFETRFGADRVLSLTFLVYNTAATDQDMPDVQVDYVFLQKRGPTEMSFGRTKPQIFNATTLPPGFSLSAGDLVVGGQDVPLGRLPEGDYRLEITIADQVSGQSLTRDVHFTVAGR